MDRIIVYLDDAEFARHQLARLNAGTADCPQATHWILVACPPRMTRHMSKWVNHAARQNWRNKWANKLLTQVSAGLQARGDTVTAVLADGPLDELALALQTRLGMARVLDARRPKLSSRGNARWQISSTAARPEVSDPASRSASLSA
ncbi:MAG: hypothetical protein Q8K91_10430 [Hylemonella sp.]|nr:hypothetical protein [Hylemonella sp.]MDP1937608.1 hypothetical protein [Hylemonella sp.]